MLAVKGYYNGTNIEFVDDVILKKGQEVIVTLLDTKINTVIKNEKFNFSKYTTKTNRKQDPQEYIRELRENDRV